MLKKFSTSATMAHQNSNLVSIYTKRYTLKVSNNKMLKRNTLIIFATIFLTVILVIFKGGNIQTASSKKRVCPDEWIDNQMPQVKVDNETKTSTQYFIVDGKRKELDEYDLNWVHANCNITPQKVF